MKSAEVPAQSPVSFVPEEDPVALSAGRHREPPTGSAPVNTADIHSPAYYFLTAALSAPLRVLGAEFIDAGRLAGAAWLAAGLILVWVLAGELDAFGAARWGACLVAAGSVNVLEASATINVDATALVAGGAVALAVLRVEDSRWPIWVAPLAGSAAGLLKVHHLPGSLLAGGYAGLRGRASCWVGWRWRGRWRRRQPGSWCAASSVRRTCPPSRRSRRSMSAGWSRATWYSRSGAS